MATNICNNVFQGVHWDAAAIQSIQTVAQGLLNLTELFKTQNITIEAMLKIEGDKKALVNEEEKEDD